MVVALARGTRIIIHSTKPETIVLIMGTLKGNPNFGNPHLCSFGCSGRFASEYVG